MFENVFMTDNQSSASISILNIFFKNKPTLLNHLYKYLPEWIPSVLSRWKFRASIPFISANFTSPLHHHIYYIIMYKTGSKSKRKNVGRKTE